MSFSVLIVGAFDPELAPLRDRFGGASSPGVPGGSPAATTRACGIGLPASAAGVAALIAEIEPSAVVLVGSCGAYAGAGLAIGEVAVVRRVRLVCDLSLQSAAAFPAPMTTEIESHGAMRDALASVGGRTFDVATTLAITVDDDAAQRIERVTGAQVEHLEAFGVATACGARGIPFAAVLGVANFVGSQARDQWRRHHREAEIA
ncbi:MAG: hypothetical protein ACREJ3_02025, partial [Polyangiaceae bacterium]